MIKVWLDPYRDSGKTYLGGCIHCPIASSLLSFFRTERELEYKFTNFAVKYSYFFQRFTTGSGTGFTK